jgi:Tripartite tricarboxylate transporter TctB family
MVTVRLRNGQDFWAGLIYVAFGVSAVMIARNYSMGSAFRMGPGAFPMGLGLLLSLIGLISLSRAFLRPSSPLGPWAWKGLLLVIGATLVFGAMVRGAGVVIALPVLVFLSAVASARCRWRASLALAVGLTIFCIVVFLKGLGIPLPLFGTWFGP